MFWQQSGRNIGRELSAMGQFSTPTSCVQDGKSQFSRQVSKTLTKAGMSVGKARAGHLVSCCTERNDFTYTKCVANR